MTRERLLLAFTPFMLFTLAGGFEVFLEVTP